MNILVKLVKTMLKVGIVGFGGGNALIPVIESYALDEQHLISKDEYEEDVLLASITPGALPIEIAGGVGLQSAGNLGMLLSAMAMALPGLLLTIISLVALSKVDDVWLRQIRYASVGINAFVSALLIQYIIKTFQVKVSTPKETSRKVIAFFIICIMTCGKSMGKLFGVSMPPICFFSAIDIFLLGILLMLCNNKRLFQKVTVIFTVILLAVSKFDIIPWSWFSLGIRLWMIVVILIQCRCRNYIPKTGSITKELLGLLKALGVLFAIPVLLLLIVGLICDEASLFFVKSVLSSLLSFGGGDAYLSVANDLFVNGGMIPEDTFYNYLVPLVNVFPGSILCKMLSGMGYMIGYAETKSIIVSITFAMFGFTSGIAASCGIFCIVQTIYHNIKGQNNPKGSNQGVRIIISSLIVSVIISFVYQSLLIGRELSNVCLTLMMMLTITAADLWLIKKRKASYATVALVSGVLSLLIINIYWLWK